MTVQLILIVADRHPGNLFSTVTKTKSKSNNKYPIFEASHERTIRLNTGASYIFFFLQPFAHRTQHRLISAFRAYSKVIFPIDFFISVSERLDLLDDDVPDVFHSCCNAVVCVECSLGGSPTRLLRTRLLRPRNAGLAQTCLGRRVAKHLKYLFGKNTYS